MPNFAIDRFKRLPLAAALAGIVAGARPALAGDKTFTSNFAGEDSFATTGNNYYLPLIPGLYQVLQTPNGRVVVTVRSEEHPSELQSHSFISYAVFCLK